MFYEFWWIIPLIMMVFCFFMMRGARGSSMCGFRFRDTERNDDKPETALEILKKRYAGGEIDKEEYEEKRIAFNHTADGGSREESALLRQGPEKAARNDGETNRGCC